MRQSVSHRLSRPGQKGSGGRSEMNGPERAQEGPSMKELFEFRPTAGKWMRRLAADSLEISKRGIALALVGLMIPMGIAQVSAFAQEAPPPPPDQQQGPPPD